MTYPTFQPPAIDQAGTEPSSLLRSINRIVEGIRTILQGKLNCRAEVTLTANATATAVTDPRASAFSYIGLMPKTANAAAELGAGTLYVSARNNGAFTLAHANNGQTDRSFVYLLIG